ncbi:MAG TPA: 6,7-dimethyl-8-ribityllumazine synthase, partial [Legionellaceae bacterium]|nr:6,7-dimethyl-8-ribityllumazine synthase [Legionellaceae bacterium]
KPTAKMTKSYKVAFIVSEYHNELTKSMENACRKELIRLGIAKKQIDSFYAPGSWEIPVIAQKVAKTKKYTGIAAFGVILKGDTYHFEMIANEVGKALMQVSLTHDIPIAMEVLAVYTLAQAKKRTSGEHNKGTEAAQALIKAIDTLTSI